MRRALLLCGALGLSVPTSGVGLSAAGARGDPRIPDILSALSRAVSKLEGHAARGAVQCSKAIDSSGLSQKTIDESLRFIKETRADFETASAEVASLKNTVDGLKADANATTEDIGKLTRQLRDLRAQHLAAEKQAKQSLQQLDAAITQSAWQEERGRSRAASAPKKVTSDVSLLRRLGRELAGAAEAPASFLQVRSSGAGGSGSTEAVLKADRRALLDARAAEAGDFRKKEKELMDLIESKRAELGKLEGNLGEQQPVLAEKSKEAAELEDSIRFAERDVKQLQGLREQAQQTCSLRESGNAGTATLRKQALTALQMAGKMVGSLDAVRFVAKDLGALAAPSLLQLAASSDDGGLGQAVQRALKQAEGAQAASPAAGGALLEEDSTSDEASEAQTEAAGPFDQVQGMIRELISDLRSQGNQDVDQNQFCLNAQAENEKNRLEAKVALDEASTQILWAKAAMERLDRQLAQLQGDSQMLAALQQQTQKAAEDERNFVATQLADVAAFEGPMVKGQQALAAVCQKKALFVQAAGAARDSGARLDTCQEAVKMFQDAMEKVAALKKALGSYQQDCSGRDGEHSRVMAAAVSATQGDIETMKGNRARRANELSVAHADEKQKKADLALVAKAAQEIESQCSVKETAEQRISKRQDQIDSLRSALKVLNGEEVPV